MRKIFFFLFLLGGLFPAKAQYSYGTTGLLNMPTAEMQRDKTFMPGASFLEKHTTPARWFYNTYNYYLSMTFLPWLEISYSCTLHKALKKDPFLADGYWVPSTYGRFVNQDRNFSVRLRLWKEGWWKEWTPQIVIGGNDVIGDSWNGGSLSNPSENSKNGFYSRYYIAATKHLFFQKAGNVGIHFAYVYNRRKDYSLNGICIGADFRPAFHKPLKVMIEYDSRTLNFGLGYSVWKDHINFIAELNKIQYFSVGVYFKIYLK